LQHQDGHSHLLAYPVPNVKAYDPAFAFELAVIIQDGLRRMYERQEDIFYYLTVMNENYEHPPIPQGDSVREGILKGMYRFKAAEDCDAALRAQLLGSGAILNEVLAAQKLLAEKYRVAADVWSVTSYKELYVDGHEAERWNLLHPGEEARVPYVRKCMADAPGVFVAASDYVKALPDSIARWFPRRLTSLGTDGFGRSDSRAALRDFFEVDARYITLAVLTALLRENRVEAALVQQAIKDLDINPEKISPLGA
jgi:pyruvate dehydrogenase E1 component